MPKRMHAMHLMFMENPDVGELSHLLTCHLLSRMIAK